MGRSIFGWSLPPGVTHRMIDEAYGEEGPCEVCGVDVDNCICPECPECSAYGDPYCYINHGMRRTEEQKFQKEIADRIEQRYLEQEREHDREMEKQYWVEEAWEILSPYRDFQRLSADAQGELCVEVGEELMAERPFDLPSTPLVIASRALKRKLTED